MAKINLKSTSIELCPKCHTSLPSNSYTLPFNNTFPRAYHIVAESDASVIHSSLAEPCTDISTLEDEMRRVEALLIQLKDQHTYLTSHVQRSRAYITSSPIRRLPTELLSLIFSFACDSNERQYYKTPLSLSLVCSRWRDITLPTPSLWTNVYVNLDPEILETYHLYVERSADLSISLRLVTPNVEYPSEDDCDEDFPYEKTLESHREVMKDIFSIFDFWKHADLHISHDDYALLEEEADGMHQYGSDDDDEITYPLESITLDLVGDAISSGDSLFLHNLPLLRYVTIGPDMHIRRWPVDAVPWDRITHLRTDRESGADILSDNFARYTQREDSGNSLTLGPYKDPSVLTAPFHVTITSLAIEPRAQWYSTGISELLEKMEAPCLEHLSIVCPDPLVLTNWAPDEGATAPLIMLPDFLRESRCPLKSFRFVMHGRHTADESYASELQEPFYSSLVEALHEMGELETLEITEAISGQSLIAASGLIEELANEKSLLPKLTSLQLVWAEDAQPNHDGRLIPALSSRTGLTSLVLGMRNGGSLEPDVVAYMAGLRSHGVRATLW